MTTTMLLIALWAIVTIFLVSLRDRVKDDDIYTKIGFWCICFLWPLLFVSLAFTGLVILFYVVTQILKKK